MREFRKRPFVKSRSEVEERFDQVKGIFEEYFEDAPDVRKARYPSFLETCNDLLFRKDDGKLIPYAQTKADLARHELLALGVVMAREQTTPKDLCDFAHRVGRYLLENRDDALIHRLHSLFQLSRNYVQAHTMVAAIA